MPVNKKLPANNVKEPVKSEGPKVTKRTLRNKAQTPFTRIDN